MATVKEAVDSKKTADSKNEATAAASNLTAASETSSHDLKAQSEAFAKAAKRLTIIENLIKILLKNRKTNDKTTEESYYKDAAKKLDIINDLLAFAALPNYGIVISTHIDKIQKIIVDSMLTKTLDSEHYEFCLSMHIRNCERWLEAIKEENRDSTATLIQVKKNDLAYQSATTNEKAKALQTGKDPLPIYSWLRLYYSELALVLAKKKEYQDCKILFEKAKIYLNLHSKAAVDIEEKYNVKFGYAEFTCQYAQEMHWEDLDLALKILKETQAFLAELNTSKLVPNSERENIEKLIAYVKNSTSIMKKKKLTEDLAILHKSFSEHIKNPKLDKKDQKKIFKDFFNTYEKFLQDTNLLNQCITHISTWIVTRNFYHESHNKAEGIYNLAYVNNILIYNLCRVLAICKEVTGITNEQKSYLFFESYYCHMQSASYYAETRDLNSAKAAYSKAIDQQKLLETIPDDPAIKNTRLKFNHAWLLWAYADQLRFIDVILAETCLNEAQVCLDEFIKLFPTGNVCVKPENLAKLPQQMNDLKADIAQKIQQKKLEEEKQSQEQDAILNLANKEKSLISNPAYSAEKPSAVHNQPQPAPVQTKAEPSIQRSSEPKSQPIPTHPVQTAEPVLPAQSTALTQLKLKPSEGSKELIIKTAYPDRAQLEEQSAREKNLLSRLASTDEKETAEKFSITVNSSPNALSQIQIQGVPSAQHGTVNGETITTIHRDAEQLEMQLDHKKIEESTQLVNPSLIAQQNPPRALIEQHPHHADVQLSSQNTTQLKSILKETKKKYGAEFFLTLMEFLNSRNDPTKKYSPHFILSLIDFLNSNNSDMARIQPDCSIQDIERGLTLFQINYYSLQLILDKISSTAFSDMERAMCLSLLNFTSITLYQNRINALNILNKRCLCLTGTPSLTKEEKELLAYVSNSMLKLQHFPSQYLKTMPEQNVVSITPIPLLLSYPLAQPSHPALTGPSDSNTSSIKLLL